MTQEQQPPARRPAASQPRPKNKPATQARKPVRLKGRIDLALVLQIVSSVLVGLFTLWVIGYVFFLVNIMKLEPQYPDSRTDIIVVLTGGSNRIDAGLDLMAKDRANAMLITGVHQGVKFKNLIDMWPGSTADKFKLTLHCCISLEYQAGDTQGNAVETGRWLLHNDFLSAQSVRIVTSNYHMPRAMLQFARALPGVELVSHPVKPADMSVTRFAFWRTSLIEYSKFVITWLSARLG